MRCHENLLLNPSICSQNVIDQASANNLVHQLTAKYDLITHGTFFIIADTNVTPGAFPNTLLGLTTS